MMPSLTPSSSSSSSSSSPSSLTSCGSPTLRVEKATSDVLIEPDWSLNMKICDAINLHQAVAKYAVKALKKRLKHKNPKVQLLALTLLETMVKNCGDLVHIQISEKNILQEMIKIVKRKSDLLVRDKILVLLDSWKDAFGGPRGKYAQYYWAYDAVKKYRVGFPQRSHDPIFTLPVTDPQPTPDEAISAKVESPSLSSLQSMRDVGDLLADMLHAVDTTDSSAVKDEVIVDLVERCRSNQKKLMQMLTTTVEEELLAKGLDLNDTLQIVLAKHDAIASGSPLPDPHKQTPILQPDKVDISISSPVAENKGQDAGDDDEEEDDFAQLVRRRSRTQPTHVASASSNALVLADKPAPVRDTKEKDMIDLLTLTLSPDTLSPRAPQTSNLNQLPVSATEIGNAYNSHPYLGNQVPPTDSYIAPWARSRSQNPFQPQQEFQFHQQFQSQPQPQPQAQFVPQYLAPGQIQHQNQQIVQSSGQPWQQAHHESRNVSAYPNPPWGPTPGYYSYATTSYRSNAPSNSQDTMRQMQHLSLSPGKESNILSLNGSGPSSPAPASGQKQFIPSYRLFEDLNVLGNNVGKQKVAETSSSSYRLYGARSQN